MATIKELLDANELDAAIEELLKEVKANPTDIERRTLLFELSCFAGDFDRAERQLAVIGSQSAPAEIGVQVYRNLMDAEKYRQKSFSDGLQPHFLTEPPAYVDLLLNAINRRREGNMAEAREILDRAEEERPALTGKVNGGQFLDIRDYNDFLAPVLEVMINGQYTWLPFEQLKRLAIAPPKLLRDLLWATARVETTNSVIGEVFIPALYIGSSQHENNQVRLGRMTDWREIGEELYQPFGLRTFLIDEEEKTILEVKTIEFDAKSSDAQSPPS